MGENENPMIVGLRLMREEWLKQIQQAVRAGGLTASEMSAFAQAALDLTQAERVVAYVDEPQPLR